MKITQKLEEIMKGYMDENSVVDINTIDSFEFIQIILAIEEEFNIEFDDEMLAFDSIKNLHNLGNYIEHKINEVSPT